MIDALQQVIFPGISAYAVGIVYMSRAERAGKGNFTFNIKTGKNVF